MGGGNSAAEAERGEVSLGQGSGQIEMEEQDGGLEISRGETQDEEVQEEEQDGGGGISRRESQDEEGQEEEQDGGGDISRRERQDKEEQEENCRDRRKEVVKPVSGTWLELMTIALVLYSYYA